MLGIISFILLVFGGINWLSIGLLQFDIIAGIFGTQSSVFSRIIYIIIGVATVYLTYISIAKKGVINLGFCRNKIDKNVKPQNNQKNNNNNNQENNAENNENKSSENENKTDYKKYDI